MINNELQTILSAYPVTITEPVIWGDMDARVMDMQKRKISMAFVVLSEKLNKVAAEGTGLMVYYDYAVGKTCAIPASIVAAIQAV